MSVRAWLNGCRLWPSNQRTSDCAVPRPTDPKLVTLLAAAGESLPKLVGESQWRVARMVLLFLADVHERSDGTGATLVSDVYAAVPTYPDVVHQVLTNLLFLGYVDTGPVADHTGLRLDARDPSNYRCWITCDA